MALKIIKMISKYNFYAGATSRIKYIVIHYTGSTASAKNQCTYFAGGNRGASAHYFVDHNGDIYQSVEDKNSAWHCGGVTIYKHKECRNTNSIGIELCCRTKGDPNKADNKWYFEDVTVQAAIDLTKELMEKYHVPADHVLRHYDVTGKVCPAPFYYNNGKHTWDLFKAAISTPFITAPGIQNQPSSVETYTEKDMWDDFKKEGYPDVAIAAWFGNIEAESGFNSKNLQDSYEGKLGTNYQEYTDAIDNLSYTKEQFIHDGAGYGLCQWTYWTRKRDMYEIIVKGFGKSIGDKKAQVTFLFWELNGNYKSLVNKLKSCQTVKEASDLILMEFEKPTNAASMKDKRAKLSQKYYEKYAGPSDSYFSELQSIVPFLFQVTIPDLNIRKGPGTNYDKTGLCTGAGLFTIVEVQPGKGSKLGWGLLKSYIKERNGWISLDFGKKK